MMQHAKAQQRDLGYHCQSEQIAEGFMVGIMGDDPSVNKMAAQPPGCKRCGHDVSAQVEKMRPRR